MTREYCDVCKREITKYSCSNTTLHYVDRSGDEDKSINLIICAFCNKLIARSINDVINKIEKQND